MQGHGKNLTPLHPKSIQGLTPQNLVHLLCPRFPAIKYLTFTFVSSGRGSLGQSPAPQHGQGQLGLQGHRDLVSLNLLCSLNICEFFAGKISVCLWF